MEKILLLLVFTTISLAENSHSHMDPGGEGHVHEELVDGEKLEVDPVRFDKFVMGLSHSQIAVVSVKGMVCDFCARGIEKIFKKDTNVKKIDVDLSKGKVLIAYNSRKEIKFNEIKEKILMSGQNAVNMTIVELNVGFKSNER